MGLAGARLSSPGAAAVLTSEAVVRLWDELRPKKPWPVRLAVAPSRAELMRRVLGASEPAGAFGGIELRTSPLMPRDVGVVVMSDGDVRVVKLTSS